ncbi:MAG: energy-coupling factor transporter transmembrane component T [Nitriliruptor sp.]|uniref:energy-coupling factor transporter transmembrane component T n=1 Tax=Nitriliruptor sp. TaxID=2448056 RepID=UPI0034A08D6A
MPRQLHPGAWWLWALGCATAASRTTNVLLLLLVIAVLGYVVSARRTAAPWARAFGVFLKVAGVVLVFRTVFQIVLAPSQPGLLLFTLPEVPLPDWAAGVTLGGPVTGEAVLAAVSDGLRLATLLLCIGAANALANPKRLLAVLPAALYEVGIAVVVAITFTPQLVESVQRIRGARRLRGRPHRGPRSVIQVALPVLEDALERSLALAAAMDSRGYGRRAAVPTATRRATGVLLLGGLLGACFGVYGLLDASSSLPAALSALASGLVVCGAGLHLAGRRTVRSRYRPDPWRSPEWLTTAAGLTAAALVVVAGGIDPSAISPSVSPLAVPPFPPLAAAGILVALLPAFVTPPPTLHGAGPSHAELDAAVGTDRPQVPA